MRKVTALIIALAISILTMVAQTGPYTVKGKVVDEKGEPVIGAGIIIKQTSRGAVTDIDGNFSINILQGDKALEIKGIGYAPTEIPLPLSTPGESIVIRLKETAINLDESVVVGYGEFSRRSITSSVTKLDGDVLQDRSVTSGSEALKGRISGLHIVQTNNTPGGGFSMKIRGGSSINNSNAPLVLVDGVERSMDEINPNDIASIDVLKDAAAAAVYGARGSNGVILITTRKGGFERGPQITFEATVAYQEPETRREFLNAEQYLSVLRPAVQRSPSPSWNSTSGHSTSSGNSGNSIYSTRYYNEGDVLPAGWKTMPDPLNPSKTLMFCDTDWQSLMFRPSMWQNYYIGVNGGSKSARYSVSAGYTDDDGIGIQTGYKKFTLKSNTEIKITSFLTANANVSWQYTDQDAYASQRNAISRGLSATPVQMVYYPDGTPVPGYNSSSETPIFYTAYRDNTSIKKLFTASAGLKLTILQGWTVNASASYFDSSSRVTTFMRANYNSQDRASTAATSNLARLKGEVYTQFTRKFAKIHDFSIMAGYSYQDEKSFALSGEGIGSSSDKLPTLASSAETTATSSEVRVAQAGFFGRANYSLKDRYLFTLVARYDASSKFMKDNRWGFFPGGSAGWVISEEPWMKSISRQLSYLKIRASYGLTGNNNIGVNAATGSYAVTSQTYNGNTAVRGASMPNADLQWETTAQLDLGLEVGLFDNRIYITADYYDKYTNNLLYSMSLPNTSGYSSVMTNLGTVRFWGWEFEIATKNFDTRNFSWDTKFVISYNRNVVKKLPYNGMDKNRTGTTAYPMYSNGDGTFFGGLAEGEPLYRFYGYKAIDIFQTDEAAANAPYDQLARGFNYKDGTTVAGRKFAGDYDWADRNGDGVIAKNQDLFCLGVTEPPVFGSIGNTFRWKDLTLDIYLDYAAGHSIHDTSFGRYFYATFSCNYALAADVLKCWQKEGDVTRYAKFWANDSGSGQDNFNRPSNIFTYKGNYLCIRDITLSYNFPKKLCSKLRMQGLRLSVSGNNLHYFTAVKGISPEQGTADTYDGYSMYPPTRRISLGLKVTF